MVCDTWQVVVVPFPFTDRAATKRRPAVALSRKRFSSHGHTVLAMITSAVHAPWPGDTRLADLDSAGLRKPCLVRLKIFTLDNRLIERQIGQLARADRTSVSAALTAHLAGISSI